MKKSVEIEGVGVIEFDVNDERLENVLDATLHVIQGAYYTGVDQEVLSIIDEAQMSANEVVVDDGFEGSTPRE